ncbi:MMPL family transporter [Nocardia bovistercoris]|uniref:MMPL family transporter n=1 Tax=Nocardia bovistercoris TaxID=2785916 RepID=A0A931N5U8_9NOCA|nr:MMPL family transporter [Nocardia bovistercoris]MBH0780244.1 MMPL family transporter [Nocardia bovistercoris]
MTTRATAERPRDARRPGPLGRWGRFIVRHRGVVLLTWLLVAIGCGAAYPALHDRLGAPDYTVPESDSARVEQLAAEHFSRFGAEQDLLVFHSERRGADSPEFRAAVDRALSAVRATDGVAGAIGPYEGMSSIQISADRHTAFAIVGIDGAMARRVAVAEDLRAALARAAEPDVEAVMTGYAPIQADLMAIETADMQRAETIGIPVAAAVLVLALGALAAATLPIAVTAAGIAAGVGVLFGLTTFLTFDSLVLSVATMIATGTAIDYAMFVVSRFTEELNRRGVTRRDDREGIEAALATALDTAGRTVLASGLIVMISLCSLAAVGLAMLTGIAIGVVTAVLATLTAAFTLLPALLATLGPAVHRGALPARLRPPAPGSTRAHGGWARWARLVMGKPVLFGTLGVAALVAAALPIATIDYGIDMGVGALGERPSGRAAQLTEQNFGPGLLAPITVLATGPGDTSMREPTRQRVSAFIEHLADDDRVVRVLPQHSEGRVLATVVPREAFDSTAVAELTDDIRTAADGVGGDAEIRVGGTSAVFADVSVRITDRLPLVIALVLTVSLGFLIYAFRSVVLALKAIVLNLLATGAALGITVAVFQYGIGESVLGFHSTGFLQIYLPMLVFAVLFGLSMDYEVFLIRRMREAWEQSWDNAAAVAEGLRHTARPITAAAAIMVAVFASFVTADVLELQQIGFALAVAIAIDALLVRLLLVPAFMQLFGRWNWWLPRLRSRRRASR